METRALKSQPDADQLSRSRRGMASSVYTVLVEALSALRLVCNQKLFAYRAYREKKVPSRRTDAT
jgi:hypothetical protein